VSKDTPIQQIKVAGEYYVLMPFAEYDALSKAAKLLSSEFREPKDVGEVENGPPARREGESALRAWRKHRRRTLEELGIMVECGKSFLSEIETGKAKGSIELWGKLARALEASIEDILPES
jgi:DNA-binding XRE family transcriptional regulator